MLANIGLLGYGAYVGLLYGARAAITSLPIDVDRKLGELEIKTMDLEGQGKVWVQTRCVYPFLSWIYPYRSTKSDD